MGVAVPLRLPTEAMPVIVGLVPVNLDEANALLEEWGHYLGLSRLCVRPGENWATRVMLRLWREKCGPKWPCVKPRSGLTPRAAVSYSKNDRHDGRIYRFDGWERVTDRAGSGGGGQWSRKRASNDAANGPKSLWLWRYA